MELWAFFKVIAHLAGASVSYGHISSQTYVLTQEYFIGCNKLSKIIDLKIVYYMLFKW